MLTFNLKTTFFTVKTSNEVYCCRIYFVNYIQISKRPYNKKNITWQLKDMDFMFSWQEQYLTRSLRSLVSYCSCHSNIKSISSRNRPTRSGVFKFIYFCNLLLYLLFPHVWKYVIAIRTRDAEKHHICHFCLERL